MGMNRAMRRKQIREQMHEWVRMGKVEQMQRLTQQGISQKDLDECYDKGHKDGFKTGTDKTLRTVYAGVVLQLLEEGNTEEEAISFLRNLDERLIRSIDAGEDIEEVFEKTGVRLMLKEDFDRIEVVS
jgi:hypothetical protein